MKNKALCMFSVRSAKMAKSIDLRSFWLTCFFASLFAWSTFATADLDPFAANNTLYPSYGDLPTAWKGTYRPSNYDYPTESVPSKWRPGGPAGVALTQENAAAYVDALKKFIQSDIQGLINNPLTWTPAQAGWFDMPWQAHGSLLPNGEIDPESGREAILGSYTGQILQPNTFEKPWQPKVAFQNHAVVYYNPVAGAMLGKVWKNPFAPNLAAAQFPEGSIVVKVEAATLTPEQWSPLEGSTVSYAYRPTTASLIDPKQKVKKAEIVPMYFSQMAVKIKDSVASPETGWVFVGFTYDKNAKGSTVWDKAVAAGAMWGNDPQYARIPNGNGGKPLQQTWINPNAPKFVRGSLGWGGRLAGPMDVGRRHNVITVSGSRYQGDQGFPATSCISCHSAAQVPFVANLYPSPNLIFPEDSLQTFLFYDPGSPQWAQWFQNRPGNVALSGKGREGIFAIDYDMLLTFALGTAIAEAGGNTFLQTRQRVRARGH